MPTFARTAIGAVTCLYFIIIALCAPANAAPIDDLVEELEQWIGANTQFARPNTRPEIRMVDAAQLHDETDSSMKIGNRTRGVYEPEPATILLARPWQISRPVDQSVLLHELVHHWQSTAHYYCPAAQELAAYKLQEKWLAEQKLTLDVNWVAIILASSCRPRDIHPD